ncbi:hypothetical protein TKK_0003108 [Trichogramma kaykai]
MIQAVAKFDFARLLPAKPTKSASWIFKTLVISFRNKTAEESQKLAAQAALNAVLNKDDDPLVVTSDRSLIISRIVDIVDIHPSGVFEHCLSEQYCQKYNGNSQ